MWIKFYRSLFWTWIGLAISREVNLRPTQTLLQSLCEIFHPQTRRRRHRTEKIKKSRRLLYSRNETNIMINTLQFSYFSEGGVDWSHSGWFYIPHDWSKLGTWLCQSPKFDILILLTSLHLILVKSVLRIGFYIKALSPKYDFLYSHNISKKLVSGHSC